MIMRAEQKNQHAHLYSSPGHIQSTALDMRSRWRADSLDTVLGSLSARHTAAMANGAIGTVLASMIATNDVDPGPK